MRKKIGCLVAVGMLMSAGTVLGAIQEGQFSFSPVVGGYTFDKKQHLGTGVVAGARAGYSFTKALGVEAIFDYVSAKKSQELYRFGGDLLYHFVPDNKLVPYLAAGASGVIGNMASMDSRAHAAFDYGAGVKYFVTENVALRGDVRHIIYKYNDASLSNFEYTAGLFFPFGGAKPAVKPVEPVREVAQPKAAPAAPQVVEEPKPVVAVLPADRDGDGVPDSLDKCPDTPKGVAVDASGCPLDSDKDGVYDYLDKCPGTPAGVAVDKDGCPLDSDKDGVPDYLDKCPGTPAGAAVDNSGCPLDSDRDGVYDYLDKCPGTPVGTKVDKDGCPEPVMSAQKAAAAKRFCNQPAVLAVEFDTSKDAIKPKYHAELGKLGEFLKEFPDAKGEISGHTDNVGAKEMNQKLSQRRAESVKRYIVDTFGIAAERISTKGYGMSKPIADNKTKAGKAKNRRIEANFTCQ